MTDEERLTAFLDGELDPAEQMAVKRQLADDEHFAALVARLQQNDAVLRDALDAPMHEDVPDRFAALLSEPVATTAPRVLPEPVNDNASPGWRWVGTAAAASLALGLFGGTIMQRPNDLMAPVATSIALNNALDQGPSGQPVSLASAGKVVPRLTFASKSGTFCRQFDVERQASLQTGIACREAGKWQLEALLPHSTPDAQSGGEYGVASGDSDPALDNVVMSLRRGDPLSAAAEDALIRRGWRQK